MAPIKKVANKKIQLQLKKGKKVVQAQQEEDNDNEDMDDSDEEEEDHDSESDKAEGKELDLNLENVDESDDDGNDDDENDNDEDEEKDDDMDSGFLNKNEIKVEKEEQANKKTTESREERNARSLYLGKLPEGFTEQVLKDLSKDIVEVFIPKNGDIRRFAIIRFNDEATAETNLSILQTKKIEDQPFAVDYLGSKSLFNMNLTKDERNARKLFLGNLPKDTTEEELKSLSEDIVELYLSQGPKQFAFLNFDSQAKAESNYAIIKDQKIKGQSIFVDYNGPKSAPAKQISVSGLPLDVTIEQVATYFKKAFQITLNRSNLFRTATISFDTEEDAKEANAAAKDATISEHKLITVLCENSEKMTERGGEFRRGQFRGGQFRGRQFRGGRNNWGKRSHDGNFRGGRGFGKKMRY